METPQWLLLIFLFPLITFVSTIKANSISRETVSAPEIRRTSADRIRSYGYPVEAHKVETVDGYILTVFRIPYSPKSLNSTGKTRPAILLFHGLRSCSDVYLLTGPNDGLPFLLADAGYDVWLANGRGNVYCREHRYLSVKSRRFWQFSWHEIGVNDATATIDYMLDKTGTKAVHLVAHSQGSTALVVLLSARPEYNEKVKTVHLMAPVVFCGHARDATITSHAYELGLPGPFSDEFRDREFTPDNPYIQMVMGNNCDKNANGSTGGDCLDFLGEYVDEDDVWINKSAIPAFQRTHPAGSSTTCLVHYSQLYLSNRFCRFDYGREENMKRYGRHTPPSYELERITTDVYIYYSDFDESVSPIDLRKLKKKLPNLKLYHRVPLLNWSHLDFILSFDVRRQLNDVIVEAIDEHEEQEKKSTVKNLERIIDGYKQARRV